MKRVLLLLSNFSVYLLGNPASQIVYTFYERSDGTYIYIYMLLHIMDTHSDAFLMHFNFLQNMLRNFGYAVLANDSSFLNHPLLANSVQYGR